MMYKLRFQKAGPYKWGDILVVVGDIQAVHSLYNTLLSVAANPKSRWEKYLAAEVTAANSSGEFSEVFKCGEFRAAGDPIPEEDDPKA